LVLKAVSIHQYLKISYILYFPAAAEDASAVSSAPAASSAPYCNLELSWNIVFFTVIPNMTLS